MGDSYLRGQQLKPPLRGWGEVLSNIHWQGAFGVVAILFFGFVSPLPFCVVLLASIYLLKEFTFIGSVGSVCQ